jgi:hypothetical protein
MDFEEYATTVKFEDEGWNAEELAVFQQLKCPADIQSYLDNVIKYEGYPGM